MNTPPRLVEQAHDATRTTPFFYDNQCSYNPVPNRGNQIFAMPEADGLSQLYGFLGHVASFVKDPSIAGQSRAKIADASALAESIQHNLTFIGAREFEIGIAGIAKRWREYLDKDSSRQVLAARNPNTQTGGDRYFKKSDTYVTGHILSYLRDQGYNTRRIVDDPEKLSARPEDTLVSITDDWVVTGTQMQGRCDTLFGERKMRDLFTSAEINLIVAPEALIRLGYGFHPSLGRIPVRSHFKAHDAPYALRSGVHITGSHSTVGFSFATDLERQMPTIRKLFGSKISRPPLTTIYRPYWPKSPRT